MANVRDSDTSLWLHNKLGTSNDSWINGSICSQLNKEVLRNIKECFPDLQTQVKLKLLLSFLHIPRRLVEEWKAELEEVVEVAGLDSELWVSMLAETMKTFPATSSLNTEISDYEDTRPIFTDMVNDLRKLVTKHSDLGMLPLECQYLNKNALISVVGQQPAPVKHFTLKRKPKSAQLRTELLHKSADAQSSLKKASAPTIPLRSRGMPRKMTDTTPLKGIPSRMPTTGGFRSATTPGNPAQRPNLSRTPAGRKDGGIKLIEFTEQPLGYAAAKKRKREQQLEEQQKKQEQKQQQAAAAAAAAASAAAVTTGDSSPTDAATASGGETPVTPTSANNSFEIKMEPQLNQSTGSLDETMEEELAGKTPMECDPETPEYATATLDFAQATTTNNQPVKANAEVKLKTPRTPKSAAKVNNNNNNNNNNNSFNHTPKRIKQEIEIKSEEIIVPATIKLEKIEASPSSQQRVIIQQQPQPGSAQRTPHLLIRTSPQKRQNNGATTSTGITSGTTTTVGNTTIKMEKLDIKPILRATASGVSPSTSTGTTTTLLTPQQLRNAANPLAHLPNNISVKITSAKAKAAAAAAGGSCGSQAQAQTPQQPQQVQVQQSQPPLLINSSTPVILASSPSAQRAKSLATPSTSSGIGGTTTTIPSQAIKTMPLSQLKTATNSGPVIISQTIIQPAKRAQQAGTSSAAASSQQQQQQQQQAQPQQQQLLQQHIQQQTSQQQQAQQQPQQQQQQTQYILATPQQPQPQQVQQQLPILPTLTSFTHARPLPQTTTLYQATTAGGNGQAPTKILLKTSGPSSVVMTPLRQAQQQQPAGVVSSNPPPLVATSAAVAAPGQQGTLNIQNVQLPNRPVTIQPASQAAQQQHMQAQMQQHQPHPQHTIVANTTATQQPKLSQVLMQPSGAVGPGGVVNVSPTTGKNKTIILTQKGVILRNIGGDMYQQIPISNVGSLQGLGAGTTLVTTTAAGPPSLVKTTPSTGVQLQTQQQVGQPGKQMLPTLIPTSSLGGQHVIVQQQQPTNVIGNSPQQTIIRPVMTSVGGGLTTLPQGLTLIQRPGQQPQLVQVQAAPGSTQRTIITQSSPAAAASQQQPRQQQQQIQLVQHKPAPTLQQRLVTSTTSGGQGQPGNPGIARTVQVQVQAQQPQQQNTQQQAPQRRGLSLSNEHVHKAHEMFRKANRVSRPDKALILGFMAGLRENPRPNTENVLVIKLGETEEKVQQEDGNTALCLVESHIRLDYNTGEWKTFQNYRLQDQTAAS
ncbi:hypothetical protein KR009_000842 [Drosophila setifemur]|nr:hypothetical protein KR009_000842 [Drosophila setifemur]